MKQHSEESHRISYFGLRQQMMAGATSSPETAPVGEGSQWMRTGLSALQRGSSIAALTLMNMALLAGSAEAQEPAPLEKKKPAGDGSAVQLSEVKVTDRSSPYRTDTASSPKYTEPLRDTPQTINVVPQAVIKEQNATNLRDVLRNVPGISIQAGEGGVPAGDNLSIRGFNARTDLFIDGVRDTGGYARDSFNFEQVEVVKGPASTYTGRGSTGGSVNIVTKTPQVNPFYRAESGFGTDQYYRFTVDLNQPFTLGGGRRSRVPFAKDGKTTAGLEPEETPNAAFRLNLLYHENDVPGRDEARSKRWGVAPSFALGLGQPTTLTITAMHFETDNVPDYGLPWVNPTNIPLAKYADQPAPADFRNYYGLRRRDYEKTRTDLASLELKHVFNENIDARYLARVGRTDRDSIIAAPRFMNPNSTDIFRELKSRDQVDTIFANQLDFNFRFETFGIKHTLLVGADYEHENSENFLRDGPVAPLANFRNPDPWDPYPGRIRRTGAKTEVETDSFAIYAFDTMKLGEHWQLSGGIRYDNFSVDYRNRDAAGLNTAFDSQDKMFSWRTALSYKPVEQGTIYIAYGTSFNPSAEGLVFNAAAAPLDPEKNRSYEIGAKWEFLDKQLTVSGAVFRTDKENARTPGLTPEDPPQVLDGEQRVQGFELGVTGNLTKDWSVYAGYTYLESEIRSSNTLGETGNELPNTPQNSFNIWTAYRITPKLEVGVGAQFVDERFAGTNNARVAPSYWTFDAMVGYRLTENIDLRLNVYNLADEKYIDRLSGGHFIPGPTRSATVTAGFKF